jgi:glutamate synthase domain-containing protein 1
MSNRVTAVLPEPMRERLKSLRIRCSRFFRWRKHEVAVNAEFEFHLDQLTAEYRSAGMSIPEARAAAERDFGSIAEYREEIRQIWRGPHVAGRGRNLRLGGRPVVRPARG